MSDEQTKPDEIVHTPESAMGDTRPPLTGPRYYDPDKNPGEPGRPASFGGVPLRDLSAEEFEALPLWLQYTVDESPMYRRSKPRASSAKDEAAPDA